MLVFLFMLLPVSLMIFLIYSKEKRFRPVFFIGVITAIVLCIIKAIFVFAHRVVPNSISENYLFFLLHESLLPQLILYGLYFLIAKDDVKLKLKSYFPLLCSFYALYLPYCVISANESEIYSGFCIFVKPLIYFAMLCQCDFCITAFITGGKLNVLKKCIAALLLIFYLGMPALIEALYVMNYMPVLVIILTSFYILVPVSLCVLNIVNNLKQKTC